MGLHTARRTDGVTSSLAGRSIITAAAAFAILGGGAGMAFAGDASSDDSGSSHSKGDDGSDKGHDGHGHHKGHGDKKWEKHDKCEIPIYDPADEDLTKFLDKETHGEYSKLGEPVKPTEDEVHDAICPPAKDLLGAEG